MKRVSRFARQGFIMSNLDWNPTHTGFPRLIVPKFNNGFIGKHFSGLGAHLINSSDIMQNNVANVSRRIVWRGRKEWNRRVGQIIGKRHSRARREFRNSVQHRMERVGGSIALNRVSYAQCKRLILDNRRIAACDQAGFLMNDVALVFVLICRYQEIDRIMRHGFPFKR